MLQSFSLTVNVQAAEGHMSLGNVSYSNTNEQYFRRALAYLRTASQIEGFTLSTYLQGYWDAPITLLNKTLSMLIFENRYLDEYGRLLP